MPEVKYGNFAPLTDADKVRWGTTTNCFTTANSSEMSAEQVFRAALNNGVRRLTQDEVNDVTSLSITAQSDLNRLLSRASDVIGMWREAKDASVAYSQCTVICGNLLTESNTTIDKANAGLQELGNLRYKAFKNVDALMVYAQTPADAQRMCQLKQDTWKKYEQAINQIIPLAKGTHEERAKNYQKTASIIDGLLSILQAFMQLIQSLITIINEAFKGIVATASFFAKYPKLIWVGGGIIGVIALLVIVRPYFQAGAKVAAVGAKAIGAKKNH